jgi:nitrate reductase cytochrome c-type subunit
MKYKYILQVPNIAIMMIKYKPHGRAGLQCILNMNNALQCVSSAQTLLVNVISKTHFVPVVSSS